MCICVRWISLFIYVQTHICVCRSAESILSSLFPLFSCLVERVLNLESGFSYVFRPYMHLCEYAYTSKGWGYPFFSLILKKAVWVYAYMCICLWVYGYDGFCYLYISTYTYRYIWVCGGAVWWVSLFYFFSLFFYLTSFFLSSSFSVRRKDNKLGKWFHLGIPTVGLWYRYVFVCVCICVW